MYRDNDIVTSLRLLHQLFFLDIQENSGENTSVVKGMEVSMVKQYICI